jgi:hypothetical protein
MLTSLAPSFLAGTLDQPSHLLAGTAPFVAFATAALAQALIGSRTTHSLLATAIPALLAGLGLLTIAVWLPARLGVFVVGDVIVGIGCGLTFKGAIQTVAETPPRSIALSRSPACTSPPISVSVPVISLGALTQIASTRITLLVFAALLVIGILIATPALLGRRATHPASQPRPASN